MLRSNLGPTKPTTPGIALKCEMILDPETDAECPNKAVFVVEDVSMCFRCARSCLDHGAFESSALRYVV